jgi:hypothetical protein
VTPTSYLELLGTFIRLLGGKRSEIVEGRRRLEVGLQKLLSTAAQVRGESSGETSTGWVVLFVRCAFLSVWPPSSIVCMNICFAPHPATASLYAYDRVHIVSP